MKYYKKKSNWIFLGVLSLFLLISYMIVQKDSYPTFVKNKLKQPIKAIEIEPYFSYQQKIPIVRIEDVETIQKVTNWLKNIKSADKLFYGVDTICTMKLYMEDGTINDLKISPPALMKRGERFPDKFIGFILVSWDGYFRCGENVFHNYFESHKIQQPLPENCSSQER